MDSVPELLRAVLVNTAGFPQDFSEYADFYSDLGMPSMKAMHLLFDIEEKFSISIPDDDFVDATSLVKLSAVVERLIVGQA